MRSLTTAKAQDFASIRLVLTDLDDTLTVEGHLPAVTYLALEKLQAEGKSIVVVTGRPAGWCDLIARLWPVAAVVGENGAFYFRYNQATRQMLRRFQRSDAQRRLDQEKLQKLFLSVQKLFPHITLSADQAFRISDYAIDFCEDVEHLDETTINKVVEIFEQGGATVKISSIHINAWIGDFSKREMSLCLLQEQFGLETKVAQSCVLYIGDSPNDEPMFETFNHSVGVSNIAPFLDKMTSRPRWITEERGGLGFAELAKILIGEGK